MRILTMLAGADKGGAETFFATLTTAFAEHGVDTRAVIRRNAARAQALRESGIAVREARFARFFDPWTRRILASEIAGFRPDVALAFMSRAAAAMPPGPHLKIARLGGFYDLKYYRGCDHLVCITEGIRRHVTAAGWPAARSSVIANFAETDGAAPADRASLGVPDGAVVVFTPSRLHRVKGLDVLLRAVETLPDIHLWLAGAGPEEAALRRLAGALSMADRVRFLGWRGDTGAFFRSCDIVAFPSRHEPFGTVTLEAWAYGKPLVVSDADGPAEFVEDGADAVMVPRDNVAALRDALARLSTDDALRGRLVATATQRHGRHFTRTACVQAYLDLFAHLSSPAAT